MEVRRCSLNSVEFCRFGRYRPNEHFHSGDQGLFPVLSQLVSVKFVYVTSNNVTSCAIRLPLHVRVRVVRYVVCCVKLHHHVPYHVVHECLLATDFSQNHDHFPKPNQGLFFV